MKTPLLFSTDKPLEPGTIYQIAQDGVKRVVTKGSAERKGLQGRWIVINEFKNEVQNYEKLDM